MNTVESIAIVTRHLKRLQVPHAFLGGAVVSLLVDAPDLHQIRPTLDVDALVQVITQVEYALLEERLRRDGFVNDVSEGAPICRYIVESCKVDVMPVSAAAIGLRSRWFEEALASAQPCTVGPGKSAPIVRPAYFLATKLEAFKDRGKGDFQASHDLEDLLAVVDGCASIVEQVVQGPADLRQYLAEEFTALLGRNAFREALPGHLPGGLGDQARLPLVFGRLKSMAEQR
jgi:hypothetical protein